LVLDGTGKLWFSDNGYVIPCVWYPAALAKHFIEKIGAIECITKGIFSIKCKTQVLYEMTLLYIKDQKWLILSHQKRWTIQWDPKLPCHPIALIMYSEQRLWDKNINI
jgi:hypothetical protein